LIATTNKLAYCRLTGKRCEYLTSLSFLHNTSHVEMEPLNVRPQANVTITFATEQQVERLFPVVAAAESAQ